MSEIPPELFPQIFKYCSPSTLAILSISCKIFNEIVTSDYFYNILFNHYRISPPPAFISSQPPRLKLLHSLSQAVYAEDMGITWMNTPERYWQLVSSPQTPTTPTGKKAVLHHVCWLQICSTFKSVSPGRKSVLYILQFGPRPETNGFRPEFWKVSVAFLQNGIQIGKREQQAHLFGGRGILRYDVDVEQECDMVCSVFDIDGGWWKSNLQVECCRLVPSDWAGLISKSILGSSAPSGSYDHEVDENEEEDRGNNCIVF